MKTTILLSATLLLLASCREQEKYDATGIFEATTVTVSAETAGKLVDFGIEEGDSLAAGQRVGLVAFHRRRLRIYVCGRTCSLLRCFAGRKGKAVSGQGYRYL